MPTCLDFLFTIPTRSRRCGGCNYYCHQCYKAEISYMVVVFVSSKLITSLPRWLANKGFAECFSLCQWNTNEFLSLTNRFFGGQKKFSLILSSCFCFSWGLLITFQNFSFIYWPFLRITVRYLATTLAGYVAADKTW